MKFNLTREEMHDHLKVKKAALLSIAINVLEIIAGVVMMLLVRKVLLGGVEESIVRMVSLMCFTIVGWGALTDIGASLTSLRMVRRTQELEEAYVQLEDLNREMRAQRHDFMNHIQVVYSLIEMNEPGEAMAYMDKIYGDMAAREPHDAHGLSGSQRADSGKGGRGQPARRRAEAFHCGEVG